MTGVTGTPPCGRVGDALLVLLLVALTGLVGGVGPTRVSGWLTSVLGLERLHDDGEAAAREP